MSIESDNSNLVTDLPNISLTERLLRWCLALLGIICVGLAALGAVLPGMPATIFLIAAGYLFTRSCPPLEKLLIRNRFFAPFHPFLDGTEPMPLKARIITLAIMWSCIAISTAFLIFNDRVPVMLPILIPSAGVVGSLFILRAFR